MKKQDAEKIKKIIDQKIEDGKLSEEEIDEIVEATRVEYHHSLSASEIADISRYASEQLDKYVGRKAPIEKAGLVWSVINFVAAFLQLPVLFAALEFSQHVQDTAATITSLSQVLWIIVIVLISLSPIFDAFVLYFVMRHKPAQAARVLYGSIARSILLLICAINICGTTIPFVIMLFYIAWQIVFSVYLHPTLRTERMLEKSLRKMDTERQYNAGTLGLSEDPKKGYIKLDFFNLFWIFVVCSILGLLAEYVYHIVCVWQPGEFYDRAGLLYGPFSPIYGFGALFMTLALNRVRNWNVFLIFIFCTIIGGAFEYFVSWFLETSFGIVAWDYTGKFLSINGRTCLMFASMFGVMGTVWIKWALPIFMKLINKIPWKIRYSVTAVCATLMIINCVMTLAALDCWYSRQAGHEPVTPVEQYYAQNYDDEWMQNRFGSMSLDPNKAARSE